MCDSYNVASLSASLRRQWYACLSKSKPDLSDVLPQWRHEHKAFVEAMCCLGWTPGFSVERISEDLPLETDNIHFVPAKAKNRRRGNTKYVSGFGITAPLAWFIEEHPLCQIRDYHVVYGRIASGWSVEKAMTTATTGRIKPDHCTYSPKSLVNFQNQTMSLSQLVHRAPDLNARDLVKRMNLGWTIEQALETPLNGSRPQRQANNSSQ